MINDINNIKINKVYHFFDDGKITSTRHDKVKISEIIEFDKIDTKTLQQWEQEIEDCGWLYNKTTDYFIKGFLSKAEEDVIFVRTIHNKWFSLGFWGGILDTDGELYNDMLSSME